MKVKTTYKKLSGVFNRRTLEALQVNIEKKMWLKRLFIV